MRATILAAIAGGLVVLVLLQQVLRLQSGPLPMVSVFELHVLVLAGLLAIGALIGSLGTGQAGAWVRLAAVAVLVVVVVRAGGELWSADPEPAKGDAITVLSWNLEMESKPGAEAVEGVLGIDADVVALQELTPAFGSAIEGDKEIRARYPYRILDPQPGPTGLGLLSKRPLVVRPQATFRLLHAGLLVPDGRTIEILDVHPTRPLYRSIGPIPVSINTEDRDEQILDIRAALDALDDPASALVVGDLNGSTSEPGLEPLEELLADAHAVAGIGPGFTWRPDQLEPLGFGVLRIDHVMTGAWLRATDISVNCEAVGDHCRLLVTLAIEPRR